jgi:branched-chain amino acid transport system ATP-binding protein
MSDFLTARGVTVKFGAVKACSSADLSLSEGEIRGLIGPNGSGKSTLLKAIVGLNHITEGSVAFQGRDITGWPVGRIARFGIVRTAQHDMVFRGLTVGRAMDAARECNPASRTNQVGLDRTAVERLLSLRHLRDRVVGDLPTGDLRKVGIALALAVRPRVLLLDEPGAGLNDAETEDLGQVIRTVREAGVTICIVDHDMRLIMPNCDRVIVLNSGENMAEGTPREVAANPEVIRLYLGDSAGSGQ